MSLLLGSELYLSWSYLCGVELKSTPHSEWEKVKPIKAGMHRDAWVGYSSLFENLIHSVSDYVLTACLTRPS